MPWKETSSMSLRREFVHLALMESANIRSLCRRYGISPNTAYKWMNRFRNGGDEALSDHSRRPCHSPTQTDPDVEQLILRLRKCHQKWGARKLKRRLQNLGHQHLPAVSTITMILHRNGYITPEESQRHQPYEHFEADQPNLLWQMDFKGDFLIQEERCYPLTLLDDHSRFSLAIQACPNQQFQTVQDHLTTTFRYYGMPQAILADNGPPWGSCGIEGYTELGLWMIRLGIILIHSRVRHPQTLGKDERFHRTLKSEILSSQCFSSFMHCQQSFDQWRTVYNFERPHEALSFDVPANRYTYSSRQFPESLPPVEYPSTDIVRKVSDRGDISFLGKLFRIGKAFYRFPVALRPSSTDGVYNVFFCNQHVAQISPNCDIRSS